MRRDRAGALFIRECVGEDGRARDGEIPIWCDVIRVTNGRPCPAPGRPAGPGAPLMLRADKIVLRTAFWGPATAEIDAAPNRAAEKWHKSTTPAVCVYHSLPALAPLLLCANGMAGDVWVPGLYNVHCLGHSSAARQFSRCGFHGAVHAQVNGCNSQVPSFVNGVHSASFGPSGSRNQRRSPTADI